MARDEYGRIDWKPRLQKWRVIIYLGKWKEKKLADYELYDDAFWAFQEYIRNA